MTKKEFLARCDMVYELGYTDVLRIAFNYAEASFRHKGGQHESFESIMADDIKRSQKVLANDTDAYNALQALAILTKSCQKCATIPEAWHLRGCMFGCEGGGGTRYYCAVCNAPAKRYAKNGVIKTKRTCKCRGK